MNKTWHMHLAICDVFWWNAVECNLVSRARAYMETTQYAPHLRILMRWIWSIASIGHNHSFCVRDLSVEEKRQNGTMWVTRVTWLCVCEKSSPDIRQWACTETNAITIFHSIHRWIATIMWCSMLCNRPAYFAIIHKKTVSFVHDFTFSKAVSWN